MPSSEPRPLRRAPRPARPRSSRRNAGVGVPAREPREGCADPEVPDRGGRPALTRVDGVPVGLARGFVTQEAPYLLLEPIRTDAGGGDTRQRGGLDPVTEAGPPRDR